MAQPPRRSALVDAAPTDPSRAARELFDGLPRRYDTLTEVLSLGQNRRWRSEMVSHVAPSAPTFPAPGASGAGPLGPRSLLAGIPGSRTLAQPAYVLDVAAGTAGVSLQLARSTAADVVGVDLTEAMLRVGRQNVAGAALTDRVQLVTGRAEQLPFPDASFDGLTFTYLLRYVADPAATLRELVRVLHPGAPIASLEFFVPPNPFWRAWWWLYTRTLLPVAGGLLGGREWWAVGRFLGPNISSHYRRYPLHSTIGAWRDAGIVDIGTRLMSLGGGLVMWGTRA